MATPFFGDLPARKHVHHIAGFRAGDRSQRTAHRAGFVLDQPNSEVHLEKGVAHVEPGFHALRVHGRVGGHAGVGVKPDLVAELAPQHLAGGNVVSLTRQIPQRHLDAADPATLPGMSAELLDLAKDSIDVAGVLAQYAALECQGVLLARPVTNFTEPNKPLIGVNLDDRATEWRIFDGRNAQVGDLQLRRPRHLIHALHGCFEIRFPQEAARGDDTARAQSCFHE